MHENRETSGAPRPERERGRSAKAQSHTADAHALEESDRAILSMNQTNKEERSSAEPGEKRARAKENIVQSDTSPTQCGEVSVPRIVRCASSSIARQSSKVGAVCGSAARTVLCGGRSVMIVPTATLGTERSRAVENRTSCGIILPNRNVDAASKVGMKSRVWQKRVALLLLVLYSIDLSWKLANWRETFSGVAWWGT
jgi:hypothetical protein